MWVPFPTYKLSWFQAIDKLDSLSGPSPLSLHLAMVGGIYEYTVENASQTAEPNLEKRTAKLQKAVAKRAEEVRRNFLRLEFTPPPGESSHPRQVIVHTPTKVGQRPTVPPNL